MTKQIEVVQSRDGSWCVVYHAADGLHHDFFSTQSEAVSFASEYYGVTV